MLLACQIFTSSLNPSSSGPLHAFISIGKGYRSGFDHASLVLLLISVRIVDLRPALDTTAPDPRCFSAVVDQAFLEPWMPEGLFRGDAFVGVVDEDFAEEVKELFVEEVAGGDDFL